jgi:predicted PurR-regulated permease PerM
MDRAKSSNLINAAALVIVVFCLAAARPWLVPMMIAGLLAFLMTPLVRRLREHRVPEILAIVIAVLVLLCPLPFFVYLLVAQVQSLVHDFPSIVNSISTSLESWLQAPWAGRFHLRESFNAGAIGERITNGMGEGVQFLFRSLTTLLGAGTQATLILILSILMVASRIELRRSVERILARSTSLRAASMLDEVSRLVGRFLIARLLVVVIVGAASALILLLFGVPYWILLGAGVGVCTVIPAIGYVLSITPIGIVALATGHSFAMTLLFVVIFIVISQIEGNILSPKLVGRSLNINALATFAGMLAGGLLWGVWGMFLSLPLLGVLRIAFATSETLQPWGELLAEREDKSLIDRLVRKSDS